MEALRPDSAPNILHSTACMRWCVSVADANPQKVSETVAFAKTTVEAEALLTSRRAETLKMMLHLSCCEPLQLGHASAGERRS